MAQNDNEIFDVLTGKFVLDKIDINEVTQYSLIKTVLQNKENVIDSEIGRAHV